MGTATGKGFGLATTAILAWMGGSALLAQPSLEMRSRIVENDRNRALGFEENRGQTDSRVRFLARGEGSVLFLTPSEAVVRLEGESASILRLRWSDARPAPRLEGEGMLPGLSHYLTGRNPVGWKTGIPSYARVSYRDLYPGIDLVFYGNANQLEHDFEVAPGGDPGLIRFELPGADRVALGEAGDLVVNLDGREVRFRKPVSYQTVNGVRREVETAYRLEGKGGARQVGFALAAYDPAKRLVIDPVLVYASYLGGSDFEDGASIAVDPAGNAYVTGITSSPDFPTTPGSLQTGYRYDDAFVTKVGRDGSLVYSTYLGGTGGEFGSGIAVDSRGFAYVAGGTYSPDFPLVNPLPVPVDPDGIDAFVAKLDPSGSALVYSTRLGGQEMDGGTDIALDPQGQAYVIGNTTSPDFPTVKALSPTFHGWTDAFVAKLSRDGSKLIYSTFLGGTRLDQARSVAVDPSGQVYVAGDTGSPDFPVVHAAQTTLGDFQDAFVVKIDRSGSSLIYSTYLGGGASEEGFAVAADPAGNAYVTGDTWSFDFPTVNALQPAVQGRPEAFVAKLLPDGAFVYSTYLGGSGSDRGTGIAATASGVAYATGFTNSPDYPLVHPLQDTCLPQIGVFCGGDAIVTALSPSGSEILFSTFLGGTGWESANAIALDRRGDLYLTGDTNSTDFPVLHAFQPLYGGGEESSDAFIVKISPSLP